MPEPKTAREVEAAFQEARTKTGTCKVAQIIAESEHGQIIAEKIRDEVNYSAATISRVLKNLGFPPITDHIISKHRRGTCVCRDI